MRLDINKPSIIKLTGQAKKLMISPVGTVIIINMLLSLVAVLRDIILASYIGTTIQADALLLAFFLPDMIGPCLLSVTIVAACVPVYAKLYVKDRKLFPQCTTYASLAMVLGSTLVFVLCFLFRDSTVGFLGSGFSQDTKQLCLDLYTIILLIIILAPLAATGNALLQTFGKFRISSFAPVLYNSVYLCGVIFLIIFDVPVPTGVYVIAYITVLSVLSMSLLTWGGVYRYFKNALAIPNLRNFLLEKKKIFRELHEIVNTFVPYILMLLAAQSILFSERYLASYLEVGAVAGLNYAYRLSQFPIWVFVSAVGMVILPSMSRSEGLGNKSEFKAIFTNALWFVLIISLPLSVIFYTMREPIVSILLQRGAFDKNSMVITSTILAGYSLAIVGLAAEYICHRVCLAMGKMWLPMITTVISACLSIIMNFYLVHLFGSAGLGYGLAVGVTLNAFVLLFVLKRQFRLSMKSSYIKIIKVLAANFLVLIIALLFNKIWFIWPFQLSLLSNLLYVLLVVLSIGAGYLGSLKILRVI